MIDWKRKLTSRKFWMAIAMFVSGCIVAFTGDKETAEVIAGLIMQGAAVVAYIIGEGLADTAHADDAHPAGTGEDLPDL